MSDNETLGQLLEAIRRFVNERLIPLEAKVSEDDAIPADALAEELDQWNQQQVGHDATGKHHAADSRTNDVAHPQQFGGNFR